MLFGERLVAEGHVTAVQCEEAVQRQALLGGRIGTNLVQLGYIDLDVVGEALGRHFNLPVAANAHFDRVDPTVQNKLPRELAKKYKAVPMWFTDAKHVLVAVMDPIEDTSELETAFGYPIAQAVAGELRVAYQLEAAYGIMRGQHLLRTERPKPNQVLERGAEKRRFVTTLADGEDTRATSIERPLPDIEPTNSNAIGRIALKKVANSDASNGETDVRKVIRCIREASNRDKIAELALEGLLGIGNCSLNAAIVWVVRGTIAIHWKSFTETTDTDLSDVAVPLAQAGMFKKPVRTSESFVGAAPKLTDIDNKLITRIGQPANHVLVSPILVMKHPVCLLYGQSESAFDDNHREELRELSRATKLAFQRLIQARAR